MKLLYCPTCEELFSLGMERRECACGRTWGRYHEDGKTVDISGEGEVFGLEDSEIRIVSQGVGRLFSVPLYHILDTVTTVKRVES